MTQPTFNIPQLYKLSVSPARVWKMTVFAFMTVIGVDFLLAALLITQTQIGHVAWVVVKAVVHLMPLIFWLGGVLIVILWWGLLTQMWRAQPA